MYKTGYFSALCFQYSKSQWEIALGKSFVKRAFDKFGIIKNGYNEVNSK